MMLTLIATAISLAATAIMPKYSYLRGLNFAFFMFNLIVLIAKIGRV